MLGQARSMPCIEIGNCCLEIGKQRKLLDCRDLHLCILYTVYRNKATGFIGFFSDDLEPYNIGMGKWQDWDGMRTARLGLRSAIKPTRKMKEKHERIRCNNLAFARRESRHCVAGNE